MNGLFNGYLAEIPAFYSFIYQLVKFYRGGGWSRSDGQLQFKKIIWPNDINSGCSYFHISQNVATLMPSLASQSSSNSLLAACLAKQVGVV